MNNDDQNQLFAKKAKAQLEQSEAELDATTLGKLRVARQDALARKKNLGWKMPATAFASLVFGALLVNSLMMPSEPTIPVGLFEDIALLSAEEDLEMYEDMGLILWLLEEEEARGLG